MGAELIPILQMAIWLIVAIMIGFVALFFYLMKPQNNYTSKSTYNSNNNKSYKEYNKVQYDDGLNNDDGEDDPITHL